MIEVKDFCKIYKSRFNEFCIKNVNFSVNSGEIVGLVGPNGSGKSTVMKAICGFHYANKGNIFISDINNVKYNILEHPEKSMELCGYVPEISCLPSNIKVLDFLIYAGKEHNLTDEELKKSLNKVIKDFSLNDFLENKIKNLSKGQQQRVSFAQALIHNPQNLILDEPISGLDPSQIISLRKYIKSLSKNKAILISTHILNEVSSLCDKAFIMNQGTLWSVNNLNDIENEFIKITEVKK